MRTPTTRPNGQVHPPRFHFHIPSPDRSLPPIARTPENPKPSSATPPIAPISNYSPPTPPPAMGGSDPEVGGGEPDISNLFCHYNALYFRNSLGTCAVSWATEDDPLPHRELGGCEYYPGGGGCIILLSKSLYERYTDLDLKNVLLHEMIHAYMCIKDSNSNHSDHGPKFQKLMNTINLNSVADPHRPLGGYSITMLHEIRKRYYLHTCESCGDLIKSTKIRGPSPSDCIEAMGANDSCDSSSCHWHWHKKRCSGSYHRVQGSAQGCVEGSKALSEEALDCKAEESAPGSWHSAHTSIKGGKGNKHELQETSAEFLSPDDSAGISGVESSSRNTANKKIKLSKDIGLDHQITTTVQEAPKRPRRTTLKKNQECSRQKKRRLGKWDGSYSVIIEWLNYYSVDESDEDEVPLINKRTERRKRQKLMIIAQARESNSDSEGASSLSFVENGRNPSSSCSYPLSQGQNEKSEIVPASQVDGSSFSGHRMSSHVVAEDQAGHETATSPLNSPTRGIIVDISDD
uniref:SprT-like domain-containing protein n=1 Tax=Leersia perrieri TaxID=77586 RepID=A0A0D9VRB4_9ORYZ